MARKQFARCRNCRQWYLRTATTQVEICREDTLQRVTIWCLQCIAAAEQRSAPLHGTMPAGAQEFRMVETFAAYTSDNPEPTDAFQQSMQDHLRLMERALHDEEVVLVPAVEGLLQRCRVMQEELDVPEQVQRLRGCVQYWEAFLRALQQ